MKTHKMYDYTRDLLQKEVSERQYNMTHMEKIKKLKRSIIIWWASG